MAGLGDRIGRLVMDRRVVAEFAAPMEITDTEIDRAAAVEAAPVFS